MMQGVLPCELFTTCIMFQTHYATAVILYARANVAPDGACLCMLLCGPFWSDAIELEFLWVL